MILIIDVISTSSSLIIDYDIEGMSTDLSPAIDYDINGMSPNLSLAVDCDDDDMSFGSRSVIEGCYMTYYTSNQY